MPLTSLSDSFVTLPPPSPRCPASLVTRPSLSSLTMVGSGGLCARALPSHLLQLQICSSLFPDAQTEEATHPQPFRSPSSSPPPSITRFRFLTQNVDSPRSTLQMRVGDPKMSIYHPHPHLQTWPPLQASWIPPPLPPSSQGYLCPQSLPPASQSLLPGWPRYCHAS